jgi:hypothetical protein
MDGGYSKDYRPGYDCKLSDWLSTDLTVVDENLFVSQ